MDEMQTPSFIADVALMEINGAPRARDLDIAERLGFANPLNIRKTIRSNEAELRGFGVISSVEITSGPKGGRPGVEYWLNEEQALLVAMFSEAPNAPAVRAMLIRVFTAWRRGHLVYGVDAASLAHLADALKASAEATIALTARVGRLEMRLDDADADRSEARERARVEARFREDESISAAATHRSIYWVFRNVPRAGRGNLIAHGRASLKEFARNRGYRTLDEKSRSNGFVELLFPIDCIDEWLAYEGHAMIAAHLAKRPYARKRSDQTVLPFRVAK